MADNSPRGVPEGTDTFIQRALDRLRQGDLTAKNELLGFAERQLRRMARRMLHAGESFTAVQRWEQTDDVFQESLIRMSRALEQVPINSVRHFFAIAAKNIRWELQTLRGRYGGRYGLHKHHVSDLPRPGETSGEAGGLVDNAPARRDAFAEISRLLDEIETIPDADRELLDLIIINRLTFQEAADTVGLSLATFKRHYRKACERLGRTLLADGAADE